MITFNIWDGAHLFELAISTDSIPKNKLMNDTMTTVGAVISFMGHGMTIEGFNVHRHGVCINQCKLQFTIIRPKAELLIALINPLNLDDIHYLTML